MYVNTLEEMNEAIVNWNIIANGGNKTFPSTHPDLYDNLCDEEIKEVQYARDVEGPKNFAKEVCDLHFVSHFATVLDQNNIKASAYYLLVVKLFLSTKEQYIKVFNEVLSSNMSKFVDVTELSTKELYYLQKNEVETLEKAGRYTGISAKIVEVGVRMYMVLNNDSGKILKPTTYRDAVILDEWVYGG